MGLIGIFLALVGGFMIVGFIAAICNKPDEETEEPPRVVISQQVPSVFDTFKKKK